MGTLLTFSRKKLSSYIKDCGCFSDHFLICCKLDFIPSVQHKEKVITFRQYHKIDMDNFTQDLNKSEFVCSPASNVSDLYDQYNSSLASILDIHAPEKKKNSKKNSTCLD